jgi:probable H4MPT-linked C1 transfer pathway protein
MTAKWLALDVGGANLKAADGQGFAISVPFPLWSRREELPDALCKLVDASPPAERVAVTMTGELADCFESKAEGVEFILGSVERACRGRPISVYLVTGEMATPATVLGRAGLAAASNWHALASFACRYIGPASPPTGVARGSGLVVDIGSTTADIIPVSKTAPLSKCRSDVERLVCGELVYTGVRRSPVCGLVQELPWREGACPVAQELFATTADIYVLLGDLPEDAENAGTADGRPLTHAAAQARMARMLCLDRDSFSRTDAAHAAAAVRDAQVALLRRAVRQVVAAMPAPPDTVILCGEGEFLSQQVLADLKMPKMDVRMISLADALGLEVSRAACAHALAVLAGQREEVGG